MPELHFVSEKGMSGDSGGEAPDLSSKLGESSIMVMTGGWFVVVLPTLLSLLLDVLNLENSTGILNNF